MRRWVNFGCPPSRRSRKGPITRWRKPYASLFCRTGCTQASHRLLRQDGGRRHGHGGQDSGHPDSLGPMGRHVARAVARRAGSDPVQPLDFPSPAAHAARLEMGHPARMKAISAGKKKSDKLDARTLADLLRANLFPACFVMPAELEGLRRQLRFRRMVVEETVRFKNKTAGLLMEAGVEYQRRRLHGKRYFAEVMSQDLIDQDLRPLLEFSRSQTEELARMDGRLLRLLAQHPRLEARVEALRKIDGVGPVTALNWALEVGDPARFSSIKRAVSDCGLASALRESAGQQKRGPLSKQRNRHLRTVLIEAAKIGVMYHDKLREVHDQAAHQGHQNRATLAVARKLVAYLLAADRAFFAASAPA